MNIKRNNNMKMKKNKNHQINQKNLKIYKNKISHHYQQIKI